MYIFIIYILKIYLSHFMGSSLTFETKAPALNRNTLSCGGDLSWIKNVLLTVMVVTHQGFTSCLLPGQLLCVS